MYFECKTGSFKSEDIQKAPDRAIALSCESVIIVGFSINEERLIDAIVKAKYPLFDTKPPFLKIEIKSNSESVVYEWHNCYFISMSKYFIEQMKTILRVNEAKRAFMQYAMRPGSDDLNKMGYQIKDLLPFPE